MKKSIFIFGGLVILFIACDNKKDSKMISSINSKLEDSSNKLEPYYISYGLPDPKNRFRQLISRKYKFHYQYIGGCMITDSLKNVVKKHNAITDSILTVRLGEDWKNKFYQEIDSLYTIDSLTINIAKSNKYISEFNIKTEVHNKKYDFYPNLIYASYPTKNNKLRVVTIVGNGLIGKKITQLNYLRALVDVKKGIVIGIDSIAYGE